MPIQDGDIHLFSSRVMADVPEGGGGPTGTVIPYGGNNNIFLDVTETDRAGGNVSMRQLHVGVLTPNTDVYMGSNIVLSQLPTDPQVSITLAKCGLFARRTEIAAAIAAYLIEGTQWSGYLLEDHVVGMRSIQIFHRPGTPSPDIGRTLVLTYQAGTPTERVQFVRVTRTETEQRTYTYGSSGGFVDYQGAVTKVDLTDALRYAFPGSPPSREYAPAAGKAVIRDTTVADAAVYYGASPLAAPAALGDSVVRVASIYTQLVPSSRTETTALDQRPAAERTIVLAEAPRRVEVAVAAHTQRVKIGQSNRGFSYVAMLKPLPEPGTVVISYRALGNWYTLTDDGTGVLAGSGSGRVIYATGSVDMTLLAMPDDASSILIQWAERVGYNNRSAQGAQVRAPEYSWTLAHPGATPGAVTITWLSGGQMRTATDNGAGKFAGDAAGEIDYPSSSIFLRPAAMIDAGGSFSTSYTAASMQEEVFTGPALDPTGSATITLAQQPIAGSIEVAWSTAQEVSSTSGAKLTSASMSKAPEAITALSWMEEPLWERYGNLVPGMAVERKVIDGRPYVSGFLNVIGTLNTTSRYSRTSGSDTTNSNRVITLHRATDDGAGGFVAGLGTVAYAAKTVVLKLVSYNKTTESYSSDYEDAQEFDRVASTSSSGSSSSKGGEYSTAAVGEQMLGTVIVRYKVAPLAPDAYEEEFAPPEVVIDLCRYTTDRIVPGSVRIVWMGQNYDDFEGVLYRGRTNAAPGVVSGTVDYGRGLARMTDYVVAGAPTAFALASLWTQRSAWNTASVFFRTQSAPIKPGGLVLTLLDLQGNALTATAGLDGNFTGEHMRGRMDYEAGVGELQFGDFVPDADLTPAQKAEWWYRAADVGAVEAGKIWRPWPVDPTTLRYNSVAYFYLPLDADILGLDPVRLPPDGRVPIYRVGSYLVVGHTGTVPAATYAAGQTVSAARTRLSRVHLVGADGKLIQAGWTADLDAGTVQIVDPATWVQPVRVLHRIEQMVRAADVQIDGTIKLTQQLSHAFPAGTVVSSALMSGNLAARALPVWDQLNWDGVTWLDAVGPAGPAPATYNDGAFPVQVTNAGALTERFALRVLTGGTDVEVIGEHVGNVGTYSRNTDIAPINPISGAPYFTLRSAGWGNGWAAGNVLFLPTVGAYYPFAAIRAVQPGVASAIDYSFELLPRGNVDRPPSA
ncbi:hypothetical protein [Acidovorax sp. SUPP3334]|uniref:hypothetical protein n=1 Tax=Acidovorax sp. SUPP3334 TaxID=2920881 RepID=UPI0023DE35AC|nr:hypothetical protein [Acidovorax sp. SUPP3334]GKT22521.1 hypothetical protein AVHM3334_08700 [Acidovorax sp. SUPP3334]